AILERDFNALWNTGYFDDLRIEREATPKGWRIHIYVTEKPTISEINYKGLSSVTQSDVLDRFKKDKVGISVESQYDPTKVKKAEVDLKSLLAEHGHQFATVRTELRRIPPSRVAVTFNIKEGPKVKVGNITFVGNKQVSSRYLRSAMKNLKPIGIPQSIFFENLFSRTYDATKLEEDAERVRQAYQEKGYFKAQVSDPKTKVRDEPGKFYLFGKGGGKRVDITVPVEEGERYTLGKITFSGNKAITNTRALRALFPIKDGDIFDVSKLRKGIDNMKKAYGELGYIAFVANPDFTDIDEQHKVVNLKMDIEEGKQFYVRRIEFQGNTTTRDKVIRRELALEEGGLYNTRLWEYSLLRLNQLQYFEVLKPDQDSEAKQNTQEGTVDLLLKVKEKGKNSIGLNGGVSGLSGSFIGLNYQTNNFLGLGETLSLQGNIGNLERSATFGFTEPYLFDLPLNLGFTISASKFDYNEAKNYQILAGQKTQFSQQQLDVLQNFSNSQAGFTVSASYPLKHSLKRIGLTYQFNVQSIQAFSQASQSYFEAINFRGVSGPNSLTGIITSKVIPTFTFSNVNGGQFSPHTGKSFTAAMEVSGIGGNVAAIRPLLEYKQYVPVNKNGRNVLGYRIQASYITGYQGKSAPPYERFYLGGENDLRGFDIRSVTPYAFVTNKVQYSLQNPDGSFVPASPTNPRAGGACNLSQGTTVAPVYKCINIQIPVNTLSFTGGDTSFVSNVEYRIPIVGPVTLALFDDFGLNFNTRASQLQLSPVNLLDLNSSTYGCPTVLPNGTCSGAFRLPPFGKDLKMVPGTNFVPRMSTGVELQVVLPVVNAPFRIYYAYNPLLLDNKIAGSSLLTRGMFPAGGAGDYSYAAAQSLYGTQYLLREPRKTFRFTVSTTF
ncbi:MAG: outer membrane protein assembly factor BamA, partial [Acidobacteriaceae bacterium]